MKTPTPNTPFRIPLWVRFRLLHVMLVVWLGWRMARLAGQVGPYEKLLWLFVYGWFVEALESELATSAVSMRNVTDMLPRLGATHATISLPEDEVNRLCALATLPVDLIPHLPEKFASRLKAEPTFLNVWPK